MKYAGRFKFIDKVGSIAIFSICLFLMPVISFAQGGLGPDCDDADPINHGDCPLDTWVIILAFLAVVFAAIYLQRKQKTPKPAAKGF